MEQYHGTITISMRCSNQVTLGGDGQVTSGNIVMKGSAHKVRIIYDGRALVDFAGTTASAFSLLNRFGTKLQKHQGNLLRSVADLAKGWCIDHTLHHLEVMLIIADREATLVITDNGDVLDLEGGIAAIGSGGSYVQSVVKVLMENIDLASRDVVEKSLYIAGELCIHTNTNFVTEAFK